MAIYTIYILYISFRNTCTGSKKSVKKKAVKDDDNSGSDYNELSDISQTQENKNYIVELVQNQSNEHNEETLEYIPKVTVKREPPLATPPVRKNNKLTLKRPRRSLSKPSENHISRPSNDKPMG